ncbi:MAG: IS1634 family transposase [Nitrososphaerota archaeon]|nr:IS1634 family transposase [Nitrososphaerota archaeon]
MVSLTRKKVRRQAYWYLQECQRVKGRPRITWQKYLGTPDRIKELLEQAEKGEGPLEVDVANFGPAAPLRLAQELEIAQTIDRLLPKRNQGYSVGEHILIAVLNRCHSPCAKLQTRRWFDGTVLPRLLGKKEGLSSQDFWNHMDRIDDTAIETIQVEVTRRAIERYGLDLDFLFYDPTNFSTYIQEHDDRGNELPKRGKAKDHRADLRLIGLALLASRDHGIPLLHRTYPGNEHDAPLFAEEIPHIRRWLEALGRHPSDVTLVFDKGNNSKLNLDLLEKAKFHYVGSLRPSLNRDLLTVPLSKFRRCYGEGEVTTHTYRVRREAHEREVTVVMTYSLQQEKYLRSRLEDILATVEKKLQEWATALRESRENKRSRARRTLASCRKNVKELLGSSEKLFRWEVTRKGRGPIEVKWSRDEEAIRQRSLGFGRTLIFTDRDEWDDEAIVRAYRAKAVVEENFRRLKDTSYLADTPEYHWTDSKIKVHQLVCFLSLQLMGLLQRQLHRTGHLATIDELAREMQQWYQVVLLYPGGKVERRFRPMSAVQEALYKELRLESFA